MAAEKQVINSSVDDVSTHSHPKVAASFKDRDKIRHLVSTHSHPKVAAIVLFIFFYFCRVSTHSHPKVAAQKRWHG